jgi:transcriptional regulator with XRE-family HTH domain
MQANNTIKINEKIKLIRSLKSWTQEQFADKLGITTHAYAKMERGETDVNFSRLQQIADIMEMDLLQLLTLDEKNIFNSSYDYSSQYNCSLYQINSLSEGTEKYKFIIEQQKKEIEYLKKEVNYLKEINNLLQK